MSKAHRVTALLRTECNLPETRQLLQEIAAGKRPIRRYKYALGEFGGSVVGDWFRFQRDLGNYIVPHIVGRLRQVEGGTEIALESEMTQDAIQKVAFPLAWSLPILLGLLVMEARTGRGIIPGLCFIAVALAWAILYYINRVHTYPRRFRIEVQYLAKLLNATVVEDVTVEDH